MPDFNPDREGHHKHKFLVQKAWPDHDQEGDGLGASIETSKGKLKPTKKGRMLINDEKFAREIQADHPRDLVVTRMNADDPADKGHNYFFTVPEMPWKRQHRDTEAQEGDEPQDESPAEDSKEME